MGLKRLSETAETVSDHQTSADKRSDLQTFLSSIFLQITESFSSFLPSETVEPPPWSWSSVDLWMLPSALGDLVAAPRLHSSSCYHLCDKLMSGQSPDELWPVLDVAGGWSDQNRRTSSSPQVFWGWSEKNTPKYANMQLWTSENQRSFLVPTLRELLNRDGQSCWKVSIIH